MQDDGAVLYASKFSCGCECCIGWTMVPLLVLSLSMGVLGIDIDIDIATGSQFWICWAALLVLTLGNKFSWSPLITTNPNN